MPKEKPKKIPIDEAKSRPCPYSSEIKCCTMRDFIRNKTIQDYEEYLPSESDILKKINNSDLIGTAYRKERLAHAIWRRISK